MRFAVELGWILPVMLLAVRLGLVLYMTRVFAFAPIPDSAKILFVLALSALMVQSIGLQLPAESISTGGVVKALVMELALGAALALAVQIAFSSYLWGGRILDMQMGFGVANLIDPGTQSQSPLLGVLLSLAATMVFFVLDAHHLLLRGIAYSLTVLPPGGFSQFNAGVVVAGFGFMFSMGLAMVAPVVIALLMIDLVVAFATKTMPQLNAFFVILPIKIAVGIVMLAISLSYFNSVHRRVFTWIFDAWKQVLG